MTAIPVTETLPAQQGNLLFGPVLEAVAEALERLRFGTVQLMVHEGKVVQLDVTERVRLR